MRALKVITTPLSVALPFTLLFGPIISLYVIQDKCKLLELLYVWIIGFAGCVAAISNARRDEVFAITAAHGAVLVVFVSGNIAAGGSRTEFVCASA